MSLAGLSRSGSSLRRGLLTALLFAGTMAVGLPHAARALGEQAPAFSLRDINGVQVNLDDYQGKVVLLNFWATWCQPCQVEMPHLDKMDKDYKDQGFAVLSISTDDARSASMVKPLVKRNGFQFRVLLDKETSVVSQYNPAKELPYNVLMDREHRIVAVFKGYNPGDEVGMRAKVAEVLGGAAPVEAPAVAPAE